MVKGITRQVIVVQSPDKKLFEQAIFIVKENVPEVTNDMLLKEAKRALRQPFLQKRSGYSDLLWALVGASATGLLWLMTSLI